MAAMLVRIGVLALAGLLGLLGSMLITRKSIAAIGLSDTSMTTITATSTASGTTSGTSSAVSTSTLETPPSAPVGVPVTKTLGRGCVTIGGVILLLPERRPLVLNPVASPAHPRANTGAFVYPVGGAVLRTEGVAVRAGSCRGRSPASGRASIASPSLFGGLVTAAAVSLSLEAGHAQASVRRPHIEGKPVVLAAGARVPVADWGYATKAERQELGPRSELQTALTVHVLTSHAGLPSGAMIAVGFSVIPKPAHAAPRRRRVLRPSRAPQHAQAKKRAVVSRLVKEAKHRPVLSRRDERRRLLARLQHAHRPLMLTPPLGLAHYVFPVAGRASFTDTYGAARSDVSWHHGDDIFAPLGTPIIAVADGTLNRVGWERLGGWRLWVRDRLANEFYYAHLSGFTRVALRGNRVKAGQVLGFVGDTGDAFGTPSHLHFEIHPRSLLPLRYDGAVDPTAYLEHWQRLGQARGSRPLHPALPTGPARAQAIYVYRELLAARGLIRRRPLPLPIRPRSRTGRDFGSTHTAHRHLVHKRRLATQKASAAPASTFTVEGIAVVFLVAPTALGATLFRRGES
jgi:murein DD-endopeptidase MepM/ murein hydrolase activator NlpD